MARPEQPSLRFGRFESKRLIIALLLSLLIHFTGWGGYEFSKKHHLWDRLLTLLHVPIPEKPKSKVARVETPQQPTVYVDVSQADTEPPKKAIYYSSKNSQAANPEPDRNATQPKMDGKQKDQPKNEDVPKPDKLKPEPPQPPSPETQPAPPRSSPANLGDEKLAKTETNQPPETVAERPRPRTLKEARQQRQMPGRQMQQDGGVQRTRLEASLDAKATAFGEYDGAILRAIQQYWNDELDSHQYAQERTGRVTVKFNLHYDGTVTDVQILDNGVGILLGSFCQESIDQTAPYGKWPSDMLREIGASVRPVTITFIYY